MEEKKEQVKEATNEKQENKPSGFGVTLLFSVSAALFPALKAGYIKPNEVLKNE